jgi:hypothetical protein
MAAMIRMIATTISNSISENPLVDFIFKSPLQIPLWEDTIQFAVSLPSRSEHRDHW